MNAKTRKEIAAQPISPAAVRYGSEGARRMGVSPSMSWKIASTDDDFKATVTLFKIGAATMALTEELDRFLELKRAKGAALQSAKMRRLRARRAKHDGEFNPENAKATKTTSNGDVAPAAKRDSEFDAAAQKKMPA